MVENTSAQATAQDWRTVMLARSIGLTASLAFFNFVLPIGDWGIFASGLMASLFSSALIAMLSMAILTSVLARKLRLDNLCITLCRHR